MRASRRVFSVVVVVLTALLAFGSAAFAIPPDDGPEGPETGGGGPNPGCLDEASGGLTVSSTTARLQQTVVVSWNVDAPCTQIFRNISGPGFNGDLVEASGSRGVVMTALGTTSWRLTIGWLGVHGTLDTKTVRVEAMSQRPAIATARNYDGRIALLHSPSWVSRVDIGTQFNPSGPHQDMITGQLPDLNARAVASELNADGRLGVVALNDNGDIFYTAQQTPGSAAWSGWAQIPGRLTAIALARNANGQLELFGADGDGLVYSSRQVWMNSATFTTLARLPGSAHMTSLAAEANADGRIELWGTDINGQTQHRWQNAVGTILGAGGKCLEIQGASSASGTPAQFYDCNGGSWQQWTISSDQTVRSLGLCLDVTNGNQADGTPVRLLTCNGSDSQRWRAGPNNSLQAYGKCLGSATPGYGNGTLMAIWPCTGDASQQWTRPSDSVTWSPWSWTGGWGLVGLSAARNADGRLEVFGVSWDNVAWHQWQGEPNRDWWSGWGSFDGSPVDQVAAETNVDGRISLYVRDTGGGLYHRMQRTPGSTDYGWWAWYTQSAVCGLDQALCDLKAPGPPNMLTDPNFVDVFWVDLSTNETSFWVQKRDADGNWQTVGTVASGTVAERGNPYSWRDNDRSMSGQCYRIASVNNFAQAYTEERCTVRPSGFPTAPPTGALQWTGLSSVNGGVATLFNTATNRSLYYKHRTLGPDLDFKSGDSQWEIRAQGGSQLMKGQAVALWERNGGGWLKTGDPFFGIGLEFSRAMTPSYEWYVVGGGDPGSPLSTGTFALWNARKGDYLIFGQAGAFVVDLFWLNDTLPPPPPPVPVSIRTYQVINCMVENHPAQVYVADLSDDGRYRSVGTAAHQAGACPSGGAGAVTFQPGADGHHYRVVVTDPTLPTCAGTDINQRVQPYENGACIKLIREFSSDLAVAAGKWHGVARTDVVNGQGYTQTCTEAICGRVP